MAKTPDELTCELLAEALKVAGNIEYIKVTLDDSRLEPAAIRDLSAALETLEKAKDRLVELADTVVRKQAQALQAP